MLVLHVLTPLSKAEAIDNFGYDPNQAISFSMSGMGNEYTEEQSIMIIESLPIAEAYITNSGKYLHLDPVFSNVVEPFVYEHFERGITKINNEISAGRISLDTTNRSFQVAPDPDSNDETFYEIDSSTKTHWWGIEWYLSKKESTYWQNYFADYAFTWSAIAAIAGVIGFPVVSLAAILMAVGNYYMYTQLRDNTSSRGTIVYFKWFPPSVYAKKR